MVTSGCPSNVPGGSKSGACSNRAEGSNARLAKSGSMLQDSNPGIMGSNPIPRSNYMQDYDIPVSLPMKHVWVERFLHKVCKNCSCVYDPHDPIKLAAACPGAIATGSDYLCSGCWQAVPENAPCPRCQR